MMRRGAICLAVLCGLAVLVPPVAWARASKRPKGRKREEFQCPTCRDTGRVPCPTHTRQSRRYRPFCSACPEPACCKGVGWKPCPKCADEATKARFANIAELYARERKGEGFYPWGNEGFFKAACEHYRFKAAATHKECHEFHAVAERAFDLFERIFGEEGVDQLQWDDKAHFLILRSRDQYLEFLEWYKNNRNVDPNRIDFLKQSACGARLITERLQTLIRAETGGAKENMSMLLHRIAHAAGHLAIENYKVHGATPPWLNEGWAGRSEVEALKRPAVYCIQYVAGGHEKRQPHQWRRTVRDAIRKKTIPTFERLFAYANVGEMGVVEWSMSISLVDWLVTKFPRKTVRLVNAIKDGTASKEAFEEVFGAELVRIEKAWQQWARRQ